MNSLFRGKSTINNQWFEGYYKRAKYYVSDTELSDFISVPYPNESWRSSDEFSVISETVGRYTECNDKNDNKIFEHDICKVTMRDCFDNEEYYICEVTYNKGCFYFVDNSIKICFDVVDDFASDVIVVGNIFDSNITDIKRQYQ